MIFVNDKWVDFEEREVAKVRRYIGRKVSISLSISMFVNLIEVKVVYM